MKLHRHNEKLNQFTLDIEFLLISVIQGLALSVLANSALGPISTLDLQYWPYVVTAFLILFLFWSQAIIHALSFIEWPLDLNHSFLYFLASFVQVLSYTQVQNPLLWFAFTSVFFGVALILYHADYPLITRRKLDLEATQAGRALYSHILDQHLFEMNLLVPLGFLYSVGVTLAVWRIPELVLSFHPILAAIQTLFLAGMLANAMRSYKRRAVLIEEFLG